MPLSNLLRQARAEVNLSELIPFTHLNSHSVFECKNRAQAATLQVAGIPFITEDNNRLNKMQAEWHQALTMLDVPFMQYVTVHRKKESLHLTGEFRSSFARAVDEHYHSRFKNRALYSNKIYLTTVLQDSTEVSGGIGLSALQRLMAYMSPREAQGIRRERNQERLLAKVSQLQSQLASFKPRLLEANDGGKLLSFLSLFLNGHTDFVFRAPKYAAPISTTGAEVWESERQYPQGNLGQYLSNKRLFFGDYIQFQGALESDCCFGLILSIKQYSQETAHVMLDPLYALDCEFIATHSFAPLPQARALQAVALKRRKLINAEDLGLSQIGELGLLEDNLASGQVQLGYHHNSLMLLAESVEALNHHMQEAIKAYACAGIVLIRETLGVEAVFCAQMPGNHHWITRASLITSHNFTDFCSLHNYPSGYKNGNHLGSALSLLETPSQTPVYFNLHSRGSQTNPAPGHTAVFGANNAGKNTLVSFLDAQMGRYNNRSFFIDRNEAAKIYVLSAENSSYIRIAPGSPISMNPFCLPDTKENRSFLKSWIAQLVLLPNESYPPSEVAEYLNECVNYAYDSLDAAFRQLSFVVKSLPLHFPRWPELKRFLRADGLSEEGEFAWLFDNPQDSIQLHFDKVGFDVTYLMDEVSPGIATSVYMLLLHRMRLCLDGRLTTFIIDEAWQVFNSPFWVNALRAWVPSIRKLNGHFIFMTQSPETILQSSIAPIILANVVTTLIFPNPDANSDTYLNGLGLTGAEFQIIKGSQSQRGQFLYRQKGEQSILCRLNLTGMEWAIRVFSGNKKSVQLLETLVQEVGPEPARWLPLFYQRSEA